MKRASQAEPDSSALLKYLSRGRASPACPLKGISMSGQTSDRTSLEVRYVRKEGGEEAEEKFRVHEFREWGR